MDGFTHLHVHTHYSLLDGANRIPDLLNTAKDQGMDAMAITDHGNLFGALEFYTTAKSAGIKPILGCEAFISPTTRDDRSMGRISTASYHLILLAMNETGWRNLIKLTSRSYLEGFYYRPRIDRELLAELNEGLICTTACLGGEVPSAMLAGNDAKAERIAGEYLDIFGPERLFIEVQNHGIPEQDQTNPKLIEIAKKLGVGIVGTNDVHFLRAQDKAAHEVLTCISTGKTLASGGAIPYSPELYLKSPQQMAQALANMPTEAITNTLKITEMCNLELDFSKEHIPSYKTPDGSSEDDHLRQLTSEGLVGRFGGEKPPEEYLQRLERELTVIKDKGYSGYFLIVNDFVQYARSQNIPAAPRGSGVATLIGYVLGIADVDPIKYGLLFERFTDPQREEAPDIDIDICQHGRAKVIQYVREKYGHVAQIITYGTLKARAAIRDVGRVMDIPLPEVDKICKLVPEGPKVTIDSAMKSEPDLQAMYDSEPHVKEMIDFAKTLEGLARHSGVHAGGVIVADQPLENLVPLCKQADGQEAITQWDGNTCGELIGLMKMDFLGLRTLSILQRCRELIAERTGEDIDPEKLPLDDPKVYEQFCKGHTDGVFQFESGGMKGVLMGMQPERIEDLIAANAMYRPGPMELIGTYCARKAGTEAVPPVHELVDGLLAETYGIMVYQEQVMQVLNRLGKLPLNRALTLIKAISKKKIKTIEAERPNFIAGAEENGITEAEAQVLFELILKFAGYGFNKAHSTRYAIVAYQSAYFKAHYPNEFIAATLTYESGDTEKVVQYIAEASRLGIKVAPPEINACSADFAVDGDQVRFGLAAVKGVGSKAVDAIVAARKEVGRFENLYHFCQNVELRAVNKSTIDSLIKCGAFDSLGASRAAMIAVLETAIGAGQVAAEARRSGQMGLFGEGGSDDQAAAPSFPNVEPWSESQLLAAEKETLGFYITSHPLTQYARELASLSRPSGVTMAGLADGTVGSITIGCMVASVRPLVTRNGKSAGKKMAMLTLEDLSGKCDAVVFAETYEKVSHLLAPERMVFIVGSVDRRRDMPSIVIDEVIPIDDAIPKLTGHVLIRLDGKMQAIESLESLSKVFKKHTGRAETQLVFSPASRSDIRVTVRPDDSWYVSPSRQLVDDLSELVEAHNVVLVARPQAASNHNARKPWQKRRNGG